MSMSLGRIAAGQCSTAAARRPARPIPSHPSSAFVQRACHSRRSTRCYGALKGLQFNEAFMAQLQESLQRQEEQIGDQVGIPGLAIKQSLAEGGDEEVDASCKTGNLVWSAGVRLSAHLVKNRASQINGARILELGSGTGILGITCASLGGHVILTDMESVLQGTYENVQANMELIEQAGGSATVAPLDWESPDDDVFSIPFDWVLGSDLTYEIETIPNLAAVLARLVEANPDAIVKLAHRYRNKELDKIMREIFAAFELVLRPVDVRTTGTSEYSDPIKVDESIIFYRVFKQ